MNGLIQKCVEELEKAEPRLDYLRGLLEACATLSQGQSVTYNTAPLSAVPPVQGANISYTPSLAAYARGEVSPEKSSIDPELLARVQSYETGSIGASALVS